jgi:type-F conjugative transfer system secretin TraK
MIRNIAVSLSLLLSLFSLGFCDDNLQSFKENINPDTYSFANNQTIAVKLSMLDSNRIIVKGDKIKKVTCARGGYCIKEINPDGSLLLGLGPNTSLNQPFAVLLNTIDDRSFTMLVLPEKTIAKTVVFTPTTGSSKEAKRIEADTPYQAMLAKVIVSMINYPSTKKTLEGYSEANVPTVDISKSKLTQSDYIVYPVRVFKGDAFIGITSIVKNVSNKPLVLNPKEFYHHGVIAGAVSKTVLKPQEVGFSYQVWVNRNEQD